MSGFEDYAPESLKETADIYLRDRERRFLTGDHPEAAWEVIIFCNYIGHTWPSWVIMYLSDVAENLVLTKNPSERHNNFLAEAMGGLDKHKLNAMWREMRELEVSIGVNKLIPDDPKYGDVEAARRKFAREEKKRAAAGGYKFHKTEAREMHKKMQREFKELRKLVAKRKGSEQD